MHFSFSSESLFTHAYTKMSIAVVCDTNIGNLCLHLCFQLNMLIHFNQQWCCFISMFCAKYSLSDNVVITKFFSTSKLGDYPSFFEQPFDSKLWWNPLLSSGLFLCFQETLNISFVSLRGWWGVRCLEQIYSCSSHEVLVNQMNSSARKENLQEEVPRLVMLMEETSVADLECYFGIFSPASHCLGKQECNSSWIPWRWEMTGF